MQLRTTILALARGRALSGGHGGRVGPEPGKVDPAARVDVRERRPYGSTAALSRRACRGEV
jgi:hypothetical protein